MSELGDRLRRLILEDGPIPVARFMALALASGRCMFTAGPGSLRCEGGTASLALGKFLLADLPLEANGTVTLQIFIQGLVSHASSVICQ